MFILLVSSYRVEGFHTAVYVQYNIILKCTYDGMSSNGTTQTMLCSSKLCTGTV